MRVMIGRVKGEGDRSGGRIEQRSSDQRVGRLGEGEGSYFTLHVPCGHQRLELLKEQIVASG